MLRVRTQHLCRALRYCFLCGPCGCNGGFANSCRKVTIIDRTRLADNLHTTIDATWRPRDIVAEHCQNDRHDAPAQARVGTIDEALHFRVSTSEIKDQLVVALGHLQHD